ncbi:MAG: DUF4267 domain-containing protein [Stygiobacter sp.]|uniref:DUF4267 domain-containing protein n=1 Tax=Stygiobacter electus TaxID=3032292 RepID=A0AAE3P1B3_9BACT|nr:DUF4267 domain-containing protein [Stygiobacter electus]MDF1612567.1 DUF4267 domain-containing protein [Stygiobacter electus]
MEKNINIARLLCLLPGIFLIVSGILLLFFPVPAQSLFDLPSINFLKEPIALAMGVRQFSIGLTITVLSLTKQIKALAYVILIGAIVPLSDFIIFTPIIGMLSALRHFATVPFIFGIGLYLLIKNNKKRLDN